MSESTPSTAPEGGAGLPDRYLITPEPGPRSEWTPLLERLERAVAEGIRLVQLRAKRVSETEQAAFATALLAITRRHGADLLLNGPPAAAARLGADGVHLDSRRLATATRRPAGFKWVAASCHNRAELQKAAVLGLDFAVLSPVRPTASHPDAEPLGWERCGVLVAQAALPVYALGGLSPADLPRAREHGACGIAAIRALLA